MTAISDLSAIDAHGHYGRYERVGASTLKQRFMSGDPATVVARARQANTAYTVVSPMLSMMPRGEADAVAGNEEAQRVVHETDGLLQWVVVNPLQPETFDQARRMLGNAGRITSGDSRRSLRERACFRGAKADSVGPAFLGRPKCVGIKIHPEEHCYPIVDHGRAIFEFAAEQGAVVLSHSGELNSLPKDFTPFVDDFPEVKLILAHLGHSGATGTSYDLQVRAILASKHSNVLTDTSSSLSITPGLIEWAVREVGAERILYGSDTPVYFAPSQRARIDRADLTDVEKRMILCDNAKRLLPFFRPCQAQGEDDSC